MSIQVNVPLNWRIVTEPDAVRLLMNLATRRLLEPFLLESLSVKDLSARFDVPLNAAHHRIKSFERAGLIAVQRLELRRGRPIKHYAATAAGFFVPFTTTLAEGPLHFMLEQHTPLFRNFVQQLVRASAQLVHDVQEVGFRLYDAGGYVNSDFSPQGMGFDLLGELLSPAAPALLSSFTAMQLTRANAKALQLDMAALIERYSSQGGPETYLVLLGMTPSELASNQD